MRLWKFVFAFLPITLSAQTDPAGGLTPFVVNRFLGTGYVIIRALASDASGNIYFTGVISATDFLTRNAAQPSIGGSTVMTSLDRGVTWRSLANPPVQPVMMSPHPGEDGTLFAGTRDGGIFKSSDAGVGWRRVYAADASAYSAPAVISIVADPANPKLIYASLSRNDLGPTVLGSSDGGETWQGRGTPPLNLNGGAPGLYGRGVMWADPNGSGMIGVGGWLSRDHGFTWTPMTQPPSLPPGPPYFTVPDPWHSGWLYAETVRGLFLSRDWGLSWGSSLLNDTLGQLFFDPDVAGTIYAVGQSGGLLVSTDSGVTWTPAAGPVYASARLRSAIQSRGCNGGALLGNGGQTLTPSFDFGSTWQPSVLSNTLDVASGPGCAFYAVRTIAFDAVVGKLAPGGDQVLWSTYLGGSDEDSAVAIAVDAQGNVIVGGTTGSYDFPVTAPRIGMTGLRGAFVTKYDPDGRVLYSRVIGGEGADRVTALATGSQGEVYVGGLTTSKLFPVTLGAAQTVQGSAQDGFAIKLTPDGEADSISYLTTVGFPPQLGYSETGVSVAAETGGTALFGGYSGELVRMSADGKNFLLAGRVPGSINAMATGRDGAIDVASVADQENAGNGANCTVGHSTASGKFVLTPTEVVVTRLRSGDLEPVFTTTIHGNCYGFPNAIATGADGQVTLGLVGYDSFPVLNPVLLSEPGGAAIARLNADGELIFLSFLGSPPGAAVAAAPDGSIYAAVSELNSALLRIPVPLPDTNADSGSIPRHSAGKRRL